MKLYKNKIKLMNKIDSNRSLFFGIYNGKYFVHASFT